MRRRLRWRSKRACSPLDRKKRRSLSSRKIPERCIVFWNRLSRLSGSSPSPRVTYAKCTPPEGLSLTYVSIDYGRGYGNTGGDPDSPPDMVGSCLVCFQGVSGCRPGVTHDMIGHRTGSRVPSLRVSAAVRCQLWLFSGQRRHGRAWQLGRVAYKPMLQAGSPMLDAARQPAPISSTAP